MAGLTRQSEKRRQLARTSAVWLQHAPGSRKGVTSVLAMMLLILFGSLAAAMAIVTQGNLRTAGSHLNVMHAIGAAESGLELAKHRLDESASRFVVEKGIVDSDFGWALWQGNLDSADGQVQVLPPLSGYDEYSTPTGIAEALASYHAADVNTIPWGGLTSPVIGPAPAGTDLTEYKSVGWVFTPAIAIYDNSTTDVPPVAFQITYAPLANGTDIRMIVTGIYTSNDHNQKPIKRMVMEDMRIAKRVNYAILGPSRIMVGKNVTVEGDIGARYDDIDQETGYPLIVRSDFYGLNSELDAKLDLFYTELDDHDVDGDNRLRLGHQVESAGLPDPLDDNYQNDPFRDATHDGYVDEFDIFINQFDANLDGRLTLSSELTAGTPAQGMSAEFVADDGSPLDDDLARLIDSAHPDRNNNGVYGFTDINNNGIWDPGSETLNDYDDTQSIYRDHVLGYRDGFIDAKDLYGKLTGRIAFEVTESALFAAQPDYMDQIAGSIQYGKYASPLYFAANNASLPEVTSESFTSTHNALMAGADGAGFDQQVADNLGISLSDLVSYEETGVDSDLPRYYRLDPDADEDGLPDNWQTAYFEKMPFASPNFVDWYYRPVYENMVFKDVQIPTGTNALFINCTFAGVTYVRTSADNHHPLWTLYGKLALSTAIEKPVLTPVRIRYGDDAGEISYPAMLPSTAVPPEQMILMANSTPLDKADVSADEAGTITNFDDLPEPLIIAGKRITDSKLFSNNLRFHDCLFVGSIVSDKPDLYTHVRNKMQFTGKTRFLTEHPDEPNSVALNPDPEDLQEIAKSSMMLPNYSVDVGSFNSPNEQDIRLHGVVIAGIVDVRGNFSINGTLLLTYDPVIGEDSLEDHMGNPIGNPALYNVSLGYFGPDDGDQESLNPYDLPIVDGQVIVGWDLDGDGLADLEPDETPTQEQLDAGAVVVPFHGFGRISITYDPDIPLPDGLMLPVRAKHLAHTYKEGRP